MLHALRNRDYRLLFAGQTVSHVGDQFHLVALPWLVLTLTHDPLQLGLVLAAAGIPRAVLMLLGGVWADRFSPRAIMLVSDILRAAITTVLVAAILSGHAAMWMVYGLAVVFGVVSGFFMPAAEAAVPRLLRSQDLESGNSLIMSAAQVAMFVGPVTAGVLVAQLGGAGNTTSGLVGIALAFALDAASFLASAVSLALMRPMTSRGPGNDHPLADLAEGLRFVAAHPLIRLLVLVIALGNLFTNGPLLVGVPVLAATRYVQGATAFGIVISAYGLGNLVGMLGAGALPRLPDRALMTFGTGMFAMFAVAFAALGVVGSAWTAAALMLAAGLGNGYIAVLVITALQRLSPAEMLGRVMSLVALAMVGLAPVSQMLAGALMKISVIGVFATAGVGMAAVGAFVFSQRHSWQFPEALADTTPADSASADKATDQLPEPCADAHTESTHSEGALPPPLG